MSKNPHTDIDYTYPKHGIIKWFVAAVLIFCFTLFSYFPVSEKAKMMIKEQVTSMRACPLKYDELKSELFMPKFIMTNISIPARCFNPENFNGPSVKLKEVILHARGLSFSPFGPHFLLETELQNNKIEAYFTVGLGGLSLNIRENILDTSIISLFAPDIKLIGKIKTDLLVHLTKEGVIKDLKLNIRSNDFVVPPQKIKSFVLPNLQFNDFLIQAVSEDKKLIVKNIILGDNDSPVRANFKGHINMAPSGFMRSTLDLAGELRLSKELLKNYSFLTIPLAQFNKKDDFYQISIKGPITRPIPSSPLQ
jgi:hypothetical protein